MVDIREYQGNFYLVTPGDYLNFPIKSIVSNQAVIALTLDDNADFDEAANYWGE